MTLRSYSGKTAVITGAGSGIGRALALDLAARGARLALSDLKGADATAEACRATGADAQAYEVDVADRQAVLDHAAEAVQTFGAVHLVINNAGVALHGPVSELDEADMRWLMDINYWGVVHGTQAFLPHLLASGDGQIANVSSVFGLISVPKQAAYNAAKFAVRGFTEALHQEMAGRPVAVSCIHPGGIRTEIARSARVTASESSTQTAALFDRVAKTSPEKAAAIIMRGLERSRARILVGPDAWLIAGVPRLVGARYLAWAPKVGKRFGL